MPDDPPAEGCWLWPAATTKNGYGFFNTSGPKRTPVLAHRVSYALFKGPIGDSWVLHHCDIPPCVAPAHLYLGSQDDNMYDMAVRERSGRAKLTPEAVREIRSLHASGMMFKDIASLYDVSVYAIWAVTSGRTWQHVV